MKYTKKLFFLIMVVALFSCNKEDKIPYYPVPQHLKEMVPYKDEQKHTFVGTNNDTIKTVVQISVASDHCTSCNPEQEQEYIDYKLFAQGVEKPNVFLEFRVLYRAPTYVFLTIWDPLVKFQSGPGFIVYTKDNLSEYNCGYDDQICHDTITINNNLYHNVVERNWLPVQQYNNINSVIYSKEKGVLKFKYKDGLTYYLLE